MTTLADHLARPSAELVCGDATNEATITVVRLLRDALAAGSPDVRLGPDGITWEGGAWRHFPDAMRDAFDQVLACDAVLREHLDVVELDDERIYTFA